MELPHTSTDVKWEDHLTLLVADKIFCIFPQDGDLTVSLKVREEEFLALTEHPKIISAPYLGRYKWAQITDPAAFSRAEWETRLKTAYELIKAKIPKSKLS